MPVITVGDIEVPDVVGLDLTTAIGDIEAVWLDHDETYEYTGTAGTIVSQDPIGGTLVAGPYTVELTVSGIIPLAQLSSRILRVIQDLDVTRPTAPTGISSQSLSETSILLLWTASTDPQGGANESNSGVAGYKVYRNSVLRTTLGNVLTFTDTGLSAYTVYSYTVSSYDGAGNESFLSATISPRTLDTTAPSAPVVTATQTGQTTISVALTTASTDSGSGV